MNVRLPFSVYTRPLPLLALGLVGGILLARRLQSAAFWAAACFGLLFWVCLLLRARQNKAQSHTQPHTLQPHITDTAASTPQAQRLRGMALPLLLLGVSVGLLRAYIALPAPPPVEGACTLTGIIAGTPVRTDTGWTLTLREATADGQPIAGRVALRIPDSPGALQPAYGQQLVLQARLRVPARKRWAGGRDWQAYYLSQGVSYTAQAEAGSGGRVAVSVIGQLRPGFYGQLLALRRYVTGALTGMLGAERGAIAAGMLHGDTAAIPEDALSTYRAAGIAHLLAVSGLHVGLLAGALLFLLRRVRPKTQFIALLVFLFLYAMFTAFSPSTLRAGLMLLTLRFAHVLRRRSDPLSGLACSLLIILLVSPFAVYSVGLQLSFTAVLGLQLLSQPLRGLLAKWPPTIAEAFSSSIAAQAGILPATAAYFSGMPLLAIPVNVLIVPLAGLVVIPGLAAVLLYPLVPGLAHAVASIAGATLQAIGALADTAAAAGAVSLPAPGLLAGVFYFLLLFICSRYVRLSDDFSGKQTAAIWRRMAACVCAAICLCCCAPPYLLRAMPHITVLDQDVAGTSYAVYLRNAEGQTIIAGEGMQAARLEQYISKSGIRGTVNLNYAAEAMLQAGGKDVHITPGQAIVGGRVYTIETSGELYILPVGNLLLVHAYLGGIDLYG